MDPEITPADPVPRPDEPVAPPAPLPEPEIVIPAGSAPLPPPPPPTPPRRSGPSPAELSDYDTHTVVLVDEASRKADQMEQEHNEAKDAASKAKKALEAALDDLQRLIRERRENRGRPVQRTLLDVVDPPAGPPPVDAPAATVQPADPLEHLWREVPVARLTTWAATENDVAKLTEGVRKRDLPAYPINTMGHLADYSANVGGTAGYEQRLVDFKGIGGAGAERIETASAEFWRWWNNGGREEFARERGLLPDETTPAGTGGADPGPGDDGPGGEPGAAGASAADVIRDILTGPLDPTQEPFVPPEDGPDEYGLE